MSVDFYSVLGVAPTASADDIKRLYKKLAVKFHPDKTDNKAHHEKFLLISEAYETLRDDTLRSKYDTEHGVRTSFSSYNAFNTGRPFFHEQDNTFFSGNHGPSYFGYYQLNSRAFTDAFERSRRYEEAERASEREARLAKQRMHEEMERRREQYMRDGQRMREQEERERMERELQARKEALREQLRRASTSFERGSHEQPSQPETYELAKQRAYRNVWANESDDAESADEAHDESFTFRRPQTGHDFSQPIIVEDEVESEHAAPDESLEDDEAPSSDQFEDCHTVPPSDLPDPDASFDHRGKEEEAHTPEVVEVAEDSEHETSNTSVDEDMPTSPPKKHRSPDANTSQAHENTRASTGTFKKARLGGLDDLRDSLDLGIEEVDFSDIRSTLPTTPKVRKASGSMNSSAKRPRVAEYTDGVSKAQTLFTPVNKEFARKPHNTISTSDLSPDVDDTLLVFSAAPPEITVSLATTREAWDTYVNGIRAYEQAFAVYRKRVMEYQIGRMEKDERHHNVIYSDTSCLQVYRMCLFNDSLLVQNYGKALQEFRETLKAFHQNCEMVNRMDST